jgi:RIO kinase 1
MDEQQDGDGQAQSHAIAAVGIAQDVSEDEADLLYSSSEDDDEDQEDYSDSYNDDEDYMRQEDNDELLGQQDWDNVSGDLTKRYNRLKQHLGVLNHVGGGAGSTTEQQQQPLPAQNQFAQRQRQLHLQAQRRAQHQAAAAIAAATSSSTSTSGPASAKAAPGIHASKLDSSLAALSSRYSSSLNLSPLSPAAGQQGGGGYSNEPSFTSNAATRKGGSERHQVTKDKSDRATTEQVLDDRTRLVLYKMLGRKRLERVEGCVSTGKEVSDLSEGPEVPSED